MADKIVDVIEDQVRIGLINYPIATAQAIRNELNRLFEGDNPVILKAEIEMWKRRAAQHGCNVVEGDHECG